MLDISFLYNIFVHAFLVIHITTCGATGRTGPTLKQCMEENNRTDVELIVKPSASSQKDLSVFNLDGIQRWTAPRGGYYT